MDFYIPISKISDFLYCPKTLYLHTIYENFFEELFHQECQKKGKIKHCSIDNQDYSTANRFLIGKRVFSQKYLLMGKIDIYDKKEKTLIERKTKIKKIYPGYKYQLYAQYFCLKEMGYEIRKIVLRSLLDNKNYIIPLPGEKETKEFEEIVKKIYEFDIKKIRNHLCKKCQKSIYNVLNW